MTWDFYAKPYYPSSDGSDTSNFQPFKLTRNLIIRAIKVRLLIFNNPTFTAISAKIYGNDENAENPTPSTSLIATSTNSKSKASLLSQRCSVAEAYFLFSDIAVRKGTYYHLVLAISGYSALETSHVAWKHAHPDPFYGDAETGENIGRNSLEMYVFGAPL